MTEDDAHDQLLRVAIDGHEMQNVPYYLLLSSEVAHFDAIVSQFHQTTEGGIELSDVFFFLGQACPKQALLIQAAQSCLEDLLYAHARFPFSRPVPLTRTALLRAVMLLTRRGTKFFLQRCIEPHYNTTDQLTYIFKALVKPHTNSRLVDYKAVIAVLTRLPYPMPSNPKRMDGKSQDHFRNMAERLDPPSSNNGQETLEVCRSDLRHFANLTAGLTGDIAGCQDQDILLAPTAGTKVGLEGFLTWSTRVQLLTALDKLFEPLLRPSCSRENREIDKTKDN